MTELRQAASSQSLPPLLFVHPGTVADGDAFFDDFAPDARAIADPACSLYDGFGLGRGTLGQVLGPAVWACGLRATRKGFGLGGPKGDPWRMPGLFLVRDGAVVWERRARHAGDQPDFSRLATELGPLL